MESEHTRIRREISTAAMQGLLSGPYEYFNGNVNIPIPVEIAKYAIDCADFLISELKNTKDPNF